MTAALEGGWVVSSTPRPHFTPGKDPVPTVQEPGWAPGPVWTGGKSRPHRDSIPYRPARSQSLYQPSYPAHNKSAVITKEDDINKPAKSQGTWEISRYRGVNWLQRIYVFIHHSLVFNPPGRSGRNQSPVMEPIWLLAHCILGKLLGVVCHCFPPSLDVPTFATTCLCVRSDARDPSSERWNCGRESCPVVILPKFRIPRKFRDLLHAASLRHETDGFTSPPKEGVLRIFSYIRV